MSKTRMLPFEGVDNFRDYGDYATAAGRRIHPGRLYRSANHAAATDADLEAMSALNLAVIVDLRRAEERRRNPSRRPKAFAAQVIDNDIDDRPEDPWLMFLKDSDLSAASLRGYLMGYYRAAPFETRHVDLFRRYFRAVADADGPVLIHCAAGKDRTGLLAAFTHHLVGVHGDDITEDYLLTNDEARFERRGPMVVQNLSEATGRPADMAIARIAMGVDAAYLAEAFRAIEAEYGSIDAYLERALGIDAVLRERVEARLLG
jgi:protein tyrosine/serine phosphatase